MLAEATATGELSRPRVAAALGLGDVGMYEPVPGMVLGSRTPAPGQWSWAVADNTGGAADFLPAPTQAVLATADDTGTVYAQRITPAGLSTVEIHPSGTTPTSLLLAAGRSAEEPGPNLAVGMTPDRWARWS